MPLHADDTIAAIATPLFPSGIGVIRISGPDSIPIAQEIFDSQNPIADCESHTAVHGYVLLPKSNTRIDESLCLVMKKPRTYTGEDVVELFMHGSPLLLQEAMDGIIDAGARQAEAGEFTYRAFINGKMSLTQAEAVHQLVNSRSRSGLRNAFLQLQGSLQKKISSLQIKLLELLSDFEAEIEFPEEGLRFISEKEGLSRIRSLKKQISILIDTYPLGKKLEEGVAIAICGPPNSGKSTLLNRLLNEDRAIVHALPGTTRDIVEGKTVINGAVIRLLDTAGIRSTKETVENIGIEKTYSSIKNADLVLWIESVTEQNGTNEKLFDEIKAGFSKKSGDSQVIRLLNKSDLLAADDRKNVQGGLSNGSPLLISAKRGWGLSKLRKAISATIGALDVQHYEGTIITSLRQKQLLQSCRENLNRVLKGIKNDASLEYICMDLNDCIDTLDQFTGKKTPENIYELIFKNYCVGK